MPPVSGSNSKWMLSRCDGLGVEEKKACVRQVLLRVLMWGKVFLIQIVEFCGCVAFLKVLPKIGRGLRRRGGESRGGRVSLTIDEPKHSDIRLFRSRSDRFSGMDPRRAYWNLQWEPVDWHLVEAHQWRNNIWTRKLPLDLWRMALQISDEHYFDVH